MRIFDRRNASGELPSPGPMLETIASLMLGLLLVFGVVTACTFSLLHDAAQLRVGDVWTLGPGSTGPILPGTALHATVVSSDRLPPGAECRLGVGSEAEVGGTLVIFRRGLDGNYLAGWAGQGPSSKHGADCGRSAELQLDGNEVESARMGALLAPVVGAMGAV